MAEAVSRSSQPCGSLRYIERESLLRIALRVALLGSPRILPQLHIRTRLQLIHPVRRTHFTALPVQLVAGHIDRPGPVLRRLRQSQGQPGPDLLIDLIQITIEALNLDRPGRLIEAGDLEDLPLVEMPIPLTDARLANARLHDEAPDGSA